MRWRKIYRDEERLREREMRNFLLFLLLFFVLNCCDVDKVEHEEKEGACSGVVNYLEDCLGFERGALSYIETCGGLTVEDVEAMGTCEDLIEELGLR